jgi:hypothetical protein
MEERKFHKQNDTNKYQLSFSSLAIPDEQCELFPER